jgi:serine protease Do
VALLALIPGQGRTDTPTLWTERTSQAPGPTTIAPNWVEIARGAMPAVVNITTKVNGERAQRGMPPMPEEFREFFKRFGLPQERQLPQPPMQGRGSGFIINKDGHILTNNHVIDNADEVLVKLSDGREFKAKVVGKDPKTDIALLKIEDGGNLPVIPLGDSDRLEVGEPVMAIGNPFGLEQTVTTGIVSAKGRVIGGGPYDDFIQTDASINPGNSGGPLVNARGEAVGIDTAIFSRTGGSIGIGFAVPVNMAKFVATQLAQHGRVERGWLGVSIQPMTTDLAKTFGASSSDGALVSSVFEGSPAEKAGLEPGDIIVEFDGQPIGKTTDLSRIVAATPVGKKVTIKIIRDGKPVSLGSTIAQMSDKEPVQLAAGESPKGGRLGLAVEPLTPEVARELRTSEKYGLVVRDVEEGSPADEAGIRRGDLITEVNRQPVRTVDDLRRAVDQTKSGQTALFRVHRDGSAVYLTLKS